jgi:phage shock protein A
MNDVQNRTSQPNEDVAMKARRLMASISAGFEDFVTRVENHEAVADCAIDDLRNATAQVRVQQGRTAAQVKRLEDELQRAGNEVERWRDRALRVEDEQKALECMRRAKQSERRSEALETQLRDHLALVDDLSARQRDLEGRLSDVQLKRTALSSRAARARTLKRAERCGPGETLDSVFDRWETVVTADEYRDGVTLEPADLLDREFAAEEDDDALRAELDALRTGADKKKEDAS